MPTHFHKCPSKTTVQYSILQHIRKEDSYYTVYSDEEAVVQVYAMAQFSTGHQNFGRRSSFG